MKSKNKKLTKNDSGSLKQQLRDAQSKIKTQSKQISDLKETNKFLRRKVYHFESHKLKIINSQAQDHKLSNANKFLKRKVKSLKKDVEHLNSKAQDYKLTKTNKRLIRKIKSLEEDIHHFKSKTQEYKLTIQHLKRGTTLKAKNVESDWTKIENNYELAVRATTCMSVKLRKYLGKENSKTSLGKLFKQLETVDPVSYEKLRGRFSYICREKNSLCFDMMISELVDKDTFIKYCQEFLDTVFNTEENDVNLDEKS